MKLNLSIGILTWKSYNTLRNTLQSYKDNGLLDLTDDITIYAQELSQADLDIAAEFDITQVIGSESNIGIGKAFTELVQNAKYDNILLLENDWKLIEDRFVTEWILSESVSALEDGSFDFIRLRHMNDPGEPLYTRQYMGREMDSPEHLLDAIHWHGYNLDKVLPEYIKYSERENASYMWTDSFYGNHTNNPAMFRKDFFLKNIAPYSGDGVALEGSIRPHWLVSGFKVAHVLGGLFKHERHDR